MEPVRGHFDGPVVLTRDTIFHGTVVGDRRLEWCSIALQWACTAISVNRYRANHFPERGCTSLLGGLAWFLADEGFHHGRAP
jgi:hypothetical protein